MSVRRRRRRPAAAPGAPPPAPPPPGRRGPPFNRRGRPGCDMAYEWHCATADAEFEPRDGAGLLSFNGRLWMLGGWNPWCMHT